MMMMVALLTVGAWAEPDPAAMRDIVAARLAALDKIIVEFTVEGWSLRSSASPLDRRHWESGGLALDHRVKIVRPNLLDEVLTNAPDAGYLPTAMSVYDGGFIRRHEDPDPLGRIQYAISEDSVQLGMYSHRPILQWLDVHIHDCFIPQLNVLRVFDEYAVEQAARHDGVSTYTATVPNWLGVHTYEFDLDADGTPLRWITTFVLNEKSLQPIRYEFYTVDTIEINGARLPSEVVIAVQNPNVRPGYGITEIRVTKAWHDPDLASEDVRIVPFLRNAVVLSMPFGQMPTRSYYDSDGNLIHQESVNPTPPLDENLLNALFPADAATSRRGIPLLAGGVGLLTIAGLSLWLVRRRF